MKKKLDCILLVDDDSDCNYFHQRLINKMECAEYVHIVNDGRSALEFLKLSLGQLRETKEVASVRPSIIFLDINMPGVNGWEFLNEYEKLPFEKREKIVVVMLTTSLNPDDRERAKAFTTIRGFNNKYLDKDSMKRILLDHFPNHF